MLAGAMAPSALPPKKTTNPWLIVFICFGIVGLVVVAAIGGVVWWLSANKERLAGMGQEAETAARAYGKDHDQDACVGEGLRKIDRCDGIMCQASAKIFTERCIAYAQPTAGFCDGVPPVGEIIKTAGYCQDQCRKRGRLPDDQRCSQIMQAVAPACAAQGKTPGRHR
jgi:hypothetical protein